MHSTLDPDFSTTLPTPGDPWGPLTWTLKRSLLSDPKAALDVDNDRIMDEVPAMTLIVVEIDSVA